MNTATRSANDGDRADVPTIAITSGKGGVGKTSIVVNLGATLATFGRRTTLVDADYGLGNIDVALGLDADATLGDLLRHDAALGDVLLPAGDDLQILPAATGATDLTFLSNEQRTRLGGALTSVAETSDVVLVDTATGISDNVVHWLTAATDVVIVTADDPAAWLDAYAVLKLVHQLGQHRVSLLVNRVATEALARSVHHRIASTAERHLGIDLTLFGWVVDDPMLAAAARRRTPVARLMPSAPSSRCFRRLARNLLATPAMRRASARAAVESERLEPVGT